MLEPEFDREQLRKFNKRGYRSIAARYAQSAELMLIELEAELKLRPSVKLSDGDVWLIFPNATISIEGIIQSGRPGPIVTRNLRKWREGILKKASEVSDGGADQSNSEGRSRPDN